MTYPQPDDLKPYDYPTAIGVIARRDPWLASLLVHQHDCIEATKTETKGARRDIRIIGALLFPVALAAVKELFGIK